MMKRYLALLLVLVMVLAACNPDATEEDAAGGEGTGADI